MFETLFVVINTVELNQITNKRRSSYILALALYDYLAKMLSLQHPAGARKDGKLNVCK